MCCTCNCHWGGERTSFLVLERSCFRWAKLFSWFEIWKQTSLGETGCVLQFRAMQTETVQEEPFSNWRHLFQGPDPRSGKPACGCLCMAGPHQEYLQRTPGKWPDSPAYTQQPHLYWIFIIMYLSNQSKKYGLVHPEMATRNFSKICIEKSWIVYTKLSIFVWILCWNSTSALEIQSVVVFYATTLRWNHHHLGPPRFKKKIFCKNKNTIQRIHVYI